MINTIKTFLRELDWDCVLWAVMIAVGGSFGFTAYISMIVWAANNDHKITTAALAGGPCVGLLIVGLYNICRQRKMWRK